MTPLPSRDLAGGEATERRLGLSAFAPALGAACYPFLLDAFHFLAGPPGFKPSAPAIAGATLVLIAAFSVPALGLALAGRPEIRASLRRLAFASVASPTLYVFLGVIQTMARSRLPDELVWCVVWVAGALWAWSAGRGDGGSQAPPEVGRMRMAHGISAAIIVLFVTFHLANHLFGLIGPDAHAAVMKLGRTVYRAPVIQPILVTLMLFQAASGLYLAWRWSASSILDFFRTYQIASGFYLGVYIPGHMNSVFVYARWYQHIQTGWNFAIGAPDGLIHGAWSIRLLPHYALGAFFVLSHLVTGLRVILLAHGFERRLADRMWIAGVSASAIVSAAIIAGMCGLRLGASW
ncbi:MAG: hypothetical protein JO111_18070 [Caulobacteraceae bacterium]|nr:hypothetical protein [Caulobacteraceae bacterium]